MWRCAVDPPHLYPRFRGSQWVQKAWESEKYALAQQRFGKGPKLGWDVEESQEYRMGGREETSFFGSQFG